MIAMNSGEVASVSYICPEWEWCSPPFVVDAAELVPLPMRYFHNEVPK
ncbi:hypothetical protein VLK31_34850 [Variovorax sp. H27-G14]